MTFYLLPTHPSLTLEDRFSILDGDDQESAVPQSELLNALLAKSLSSLGHASPTKVLIDLIEDIASLVHDDGSIDTGFLSDYMNSRRDDESRAEYSLHDIVRSILVTAQSMAEVFQLRFHSIPQLGKTGASNVELTGEEVNVLLAHQLLGTLSQPEGNTWGIPCFTSWYGAQAQPSLAVRGYLDILFMHFAGNLYRKTQSFRFTAAWASDDLDPNNFSKPIKFRVKIVREETDAFQDRALPTESLLVACHSQPGPGPGGTHEERLMASSPALAIASLLCPVLDNDMAVATSEFPVHAIFKGHNRTAEVYQMYSRLDDMPKRCYILADALELDAVDDLTGDALRDLQGNRVLREVRKLFAALLAAQCASPNVSTVYSPLWGCGAFGGNPVVKAICMMMAASLAGVELCLIVLDSRKCALNDLIDIEDWILFKQLFARVTSEEANSWSIADL
jgi:hypothetical protein